MRRSLSAVLAAAALAAGALFIVPPAAGATKAPLKCTTKQIEAKSFRLCSGLVRSKDGAVALDTDVTLPARGAGPFPLIVMLHGLGGDKNSTAATDSVAGTGSKYHYNNAWFASRGYAVMSYTARGFHEDRCLDSSIPSADASAAYPSSPACLPQLVHKDHEIKDTQYLIGRLVDGTLTSSGVKAKPKKIGVTGLSYGGGHTWSLTRMNKWRSPAGERIKLNAAVPVIGWSDLVEALLPNGLARSRYAPPALEERLAEPTGIPKSSYIFAFYYLMNTAASTPWQVPGYFNTWYERFTNAGPYTDAVAADAIRALLEDRSAAYIAKKATHRTPVLAINAWTDQVFGAIQSVGMIEQLLAEDPDYPVSAYLGDWGHPASQSSSDEWAHQADLINAWFDHYLRGKGTRPAKYVESSLTVCSGSDAGDSLSRGTSFADLQGEPADHALADIEGTLDSAAEDPHKKRLTPTDSPSNACRTTDTAVATGNLAQSVAIAEDVTMLGIPEVSFTATPSAAGMYVAFHLWDVHDGQQTLVDRGIVRLGDATKQQVSARLAGNHYRFVAGHELKLELTANDSPTFLGQTGTVAVDDVRLELPLADPANQM